MASQLEPLTDPHGYAIDRARLTYHRRYASHAKGMPRVRTVAELEGYAPLGSALVPCGECWPAKAEAATERHPIDRNVVTLTDGIAEDVTGEDVTNDYLVEVDRGSPAEEPGLPVGVSTAREKARGAARRRVAAPAADPSPLPSEPDPDVEPDEPITDEA